MDRSCRAADGVLGCARVTQSEQPSLNLQIVHCLSPDGASGLLGADSPLLPGAARSWRWPEVEFPTRLGRRLERLAVRERPAVVSCAGCHAVTGGTGGLGRAVAAWLMANGASRVLLLSRTRPARADDLPDGCAWVRCDVCDIASVRSALAAVGGELVTVFHCAGVVADALVTNAPTDTEALGLEMGAKVLP